MLSAAPAISLVEPFREARAGKSLGLLRPKGADRHQLVLRPVRLNDGEALQSYFRRLSRESRFNRVLGFTSELAPAELERTLTANGRERLSWLLTSTAETGEIVVGETRMAVSCAERSAEFSMSIADDWRRLGVGSALLREIERKAAADGVEWLFGDVLRTNDAMIALAQSRDFDLERGLEGRLLRVRRRLVDVAPELPCQQWAEIVASHHSLTWGTQ
jgi:GNAT superfamily N-acetyltransferase